MTVAGTPYQPPVVSSTIGTMGTIFATTTVANSGVFVADGAISGNFDIYYGTPPPAVATGRMESPSEVRPWMLARAGWDARRGAMRLFAPGPSAAHRRFNDAPPGVMASGGGKAERKREKRERAQRRRAGEQIVDRPRSDVVFSAQDERAVIVNGVRRHYFKFFLSRRGELLNGANVFGFDCSAFLRFLEGRGNYERTFKFIALTATGNIKSWRRLSPVVEQAGSTDALSSAEAAIDAEFARMFPDNPNLRSEHGVWTDLMYALEDYRQGRRTAHDVVILLVEYSHHSEDRPRIAEGGVTFGPVSLGREFLIKLCRESTRQTADGFYSGMTSNERAVYEMFSEVAEGRTTIDQIAGEIQGGVRRPMRIGVGISMKIQFAMTDEQISNFLNREDISEDVKWMMIVTSIFTNKDFNEETVVLFDPVGGKGLARREPKEVERQIRLLYNRAFGIADSTRTSDRTEGAITPLPLDQILPFRPQAEMDAGRSLTFLIHSAYLLRLAVSWLRNLSMMRIDSLRPAIRRVARFFEDDRVPISARAMVADIMTQLFVGAPSVLDEVLMALDVLKSDPARFDDGVRLLYIQEHPRAQAVLDAVAGLKREDPRTILSGRQFKTEAARNGWRGFLMEAERRGLPATRMIDVFSDVIAKAGVSSDTYEGWFSELPRMISRFNDGDWGMFGSYAPSDGADGVARAVEMAYRLHDMVYPPGGEWIRDKDFQGRMSFLLPRDLDGFNSTISAAADETRLAHRTYIERRPDDPDFDEFLPLRYWLRLWPQTGVGHLQAALTRLSTWANGGEDGVYPYLVRRLIRRSIGDTLALRSLLVMAAFPDLDGPLISRILSTANELLESGEITGDVLGLVLENIRKAKMASYGPASRAELTSVRTLLRAGYGVTIIPADEKMERQRPDLITTRPDGSSMIVEIKSVAQTVGALGYLNTVRRQIETAASQLKSFASENGGAQMAIHLYLIGNGVKGVSILAENEVVQAIKAGGERTGGINTVLIIPVDTAGGGWNVGEVAVIRP